MFSVEDIFAGTIASSPTLTLVADQYPSFRPGPWPGATGPPGWTAADPAPLGARVAHVWHDDGPPADPGTVAASFVWLSGGSWPLAGTI
jgi:hypothetical protein